ncbi:ABC transporter substrate-binding protein [Dictyobacter aurantiacus]|uniref:ABC transporter substrate-binding protein n=1 Tax=Dictyobacter aurantiacus TaxID=1936993 RepID=A0A401ZRG9_9CHLR|nr:extracellular solute-binding protein [Dictyobacter aurantiacus]GCE09394.1 ABC transporter substrate-binding protein [Dictyobacter aurantiacus]
MFLFRRPQQVNVDQLVEDYTTQGFSRRVFLQRATALGLSFGSATALLAACGEQPGSSASGNSASGGGATNLKLIMHVNAPAVQAMHDLNDAFHKKYPDITVSVSTAPTDTFATLQQTRLAAKDVDIIEVTSFVGALTSYTPGLEKPGWVKQIEAGNYVDLTGQPFVKNFSPDAIKNTSSYNGKVYSIPSGSAAFTGVFYSKSIFSKYNLQVPTTWSELMDICQHLQGKGVTPFTIGQKDGWPAGLPSQALLSAMYPDLQAFDKGMWTNSMKYTDPRFVQVLQRAQQIWSYTEKGFGGISYATTPARFVAGKAAMMPDGVWTAPSLQQADSSFEFGYFPLPGSDTASENDFLAGKYDISWAVASSSKNQDAAMKWLAFYSDPANYSKFINADGLVPAQPNTQTTPFLQSIAKWTNSMRLSPDQVLHNKQHGGKYTDFVGMSSAPCPTVYLAPLGSMDSPQSLAQKMESDWLAAKS